MRATPSWGAAKKPDHQLTPQCILKADQSRYRLVHDLRVVNEVVEDFDAVVRNPPTLLTNVPQSSRYFTDINLTSAFFSVPLSESAQYLFAFTY